MAIFTPELLKKLELGYYFWPILVVILAAIVVLNYLINLWFIKKALKWIPKSPAVPYFGHSLQFVGKSSSECWNITSNLLDKYDGLTQIWLCNRAFVLSSRSEIAQRILKGSYDTLTRKSVHYSFIKDILGNSLTTMSGIVWWNRRKVYDNYFKDRSMDGFVPNICHHARALVSSIKDKVKMSETVDLQDYPKLASLDVNIDSLFKSSNNFLNHPNPSYLNALESANEIIAKRVHVPFYDSNIFYLFTWTNLLQMKAVKKIKELSSKIINIRQKYRGNEKNQDENENNGPLNFLDFLLEKQDKQILNEKDIQSEVNTIIYKAYNAVTSGVAFTLYLLGQHPDLQEKVFKEIKSILPDLGSERNPSMNQFNKLKYLGQCIKESLRLYPPVPWIGRELKNYLKMGEGRNTLPEGSTVVINVYKLHRNDKYYKNANQFNPDRFSNDDEKENFTFIPFGAGWRSCIGQKFAMLEMKIMLAYILNQYHVTSVHKEEDLKLNGNVFLKSEKGLLAKLKARK